MSRTGELYGLGDGGGIYTIDTRTAEAFKVTELTVDLQGASFGVDFNPAANALRIISDTGQNLRHPFAGPLQFQTQTDMPLNYTPGTNATGVTGAAYTNNDLDTNTNTTLFDIDTTLDQVSIQSPPNNGSLVATGLLTVDADTPVGFDNLHAAAQGHGGRQQCVCHAGRQWNDRLLPDKPACRYRDPYRQLLPRQERRLQRPRHRHRDSTQTISGTRARPGALHAPGRL